MKKRNNRAKRREKRDRHRRQAQRAIFAAADAIETACRSLLKAIESRTIPSRYDYL